jgi:lantibiotic modifying enzyme
VERSLHFEKLSRAFVLGPVKPAFWLILEAERQSLEEMDIPLFGCNTSRNELFSKETSVVQDWFDDSGYQGVLSRLQMMDEPDLEHQRRVIAEALRSRFAGESFNFEKFMV